MVTVLEEARIVAQLARAGHPPKRTIIYAGWDGEEEGLLGSVEWAETHADELRQHAVGLHQHRLELPRLPRRRRLPLAGAPGQPGRRGRHRSGDGRERRRASPGVAAGRGRPEDQEELASRADLRISALGSGSDYTPFLQHLGIASINLGYGGEGDYGQYHSIYDSIDHYQRFIDPDYAYGAALVETAGRLTLRLANAEILPLRFGNAAETYSGYVDDLMASTDAMREETETANRRIDDGVWQLYADPTKTLLPPEKKSPVPYLELAPLQNVAKTLDEVARQYDEDLAALADRDQPLPPATRDQLNELLRTAERALTRREGLPGRSWYVHHVYAPGFYTGYGVKTLPAAREAIEQREWKQADIQISVTAGVLREYAAQIERAAKLLEQSRVSAAGDGFGGPGGGYVAGAPPDGDGPVSDGPPGRTPADAPG